MFDFSKLVGFYRQDLEDKDYLLSTQVDATYLSFGDLPERIDPRNHPLVSEGWLQVEDQGQIGSCTIKGTKIKLSDGSFKNVEDLTKDDDVISHTGKSRKIVNLFRKKYSGDIYKKKLDNGFTIETTADHKFLLENEDGSIKKIRADALSDFHELLVSTTSSTEDKTTIDVADYVSENYKISMEKISGKTSSKSIPRYLELTEDLCWLLGIYAAEGYTSGPKSSKNKNVNFAFHKKEDFLHIKVRRIIAEIFGFESKIEFSKSHNGCNIRTHSIILGEFLANLMGSGCKNKKVPSEILGSSEKCRKAFIKGWLDGDGHYSYIDKEKKNVRATGYTISKNLYMGICSISLSLGLNPRISIRNRKNRNRSYDVRFLGNDIKTLVPKEEIPEWASEYLENKKVVVKDKVSLNYRLVKIKEITTYKVKDLTVYDFEVESDHSYCANNMYISNCQGQALTECIEYCYTVATNKVLQFSRMFAYLESQKFDNIRSDSGSTLSGGTRAVKQSGICRESIALYPNRYPGHSWVTQTMREDAAKYKLLSHTNMSSVDQIKSFIGSGIGVVQIGISWNGSMSPSSNGVISNFSAGGGGGHSVGIVGYVPDSDVGARSSAGYWFLLKNSWGTRWGVKGFAYVDPRAVEQMLRHQWTVMIGRSEMVHPEPRPVPVDFTKPGQSMYA